MAKNKTVKKVPVGKLIKRQISYFDGSSLCPIFFDIPLCTHGVEYCGIPGL